MNATELANRLINELEEKAEFHRTNTNDPHGIGTAVQVALSEVAQAIKDAQAMDKLKEAK